MPKQTLVFEKPVQLSIKNAQLCIAYKDKPEEEYFRAIEDINPHANIHAHEFGLKLHAGEIIGLGILCTVSEFLQTWIS